MQRVHRGTFNLKYCIFMRIRPDYHRRVKFFFDLGIEGKGEGREREIRSLRVRGSKNRLLTASETRSRRDNYKILARDEEEGTDANSTDDSTLSFAFPSR